MCVLVSTSTLLTTVSNVHSLRDSLFRDTDHQRQITTNVVVGDLQL